MKDFDRKILTKRECLHRDFLETKTKLCSSLTTTLSKLKILRIVLYMEEMEKWMIFEEIIILLNSFRVYIFFCTACRLFVYSWFMDDDTLFHCKAYDTH